MGVLCEGTPFRLVQGEPTGQPHISFGGRGDSYFDTHPIREKCGKKAFLRDSVYMVGLLSTCSECVPIMEKQYSRRRVQHERALILDLQVQQLFLS